MIGTVMMWACMVLLGALAIGFALCVALCILAVVSQWRDKEMLLMWSFMLLFSAGACAGFVFAVIGIGRDLL